MWKREKETKSQLSDEESLTVDEFQGRESSCRLARTYFVILVGARSHEDRVKNCREANHVQRSHFVAPGTDLDGTAAFHFSAVHDVSNITSVPHTIDTQIRGQITRSSRCLLPSGRTSDVPYFCPVVAGRAFGPLTILGNRCLICLFTSRIPCARIPRG